MSHRLSAAFKFLALGTAVSLPVSAFAQAGGTFVDARCNIFGYGVSAPEPGGGGGGLVAVTIVLTPGTGRTITFSASGEAGWSNEIDNGPDGGSFADSTDISGLGPISGFTAPLSGHLVGLFIEAGDISGLSAPAAGSYADISAFSAASYSPLTRQVFFIGDGLTGTGTGATQTFAIPDSAYALVLGIADAFAFNAEPGYYGDNVGGYTVGYNAVPAPSTAVALGLLGAAGARRRR